MAAGEEDEQEQGRRSSNKKTAGRTSRRRAAGRTSGSKSKHAAHRVSAPQAMRYATEQLEQLLGRAPESVSSVKPTDEGWEADVEVVEVGRVPDTTSVMASYRVTLDEEGELMAYERTRRYTRGQIDPRT